MVGIADRIQEQRKETVLHEHATKNILFFCSKKSRGRVTCTLFPCVIKIMSFWATPLRWPLFGYNKKIDHCSASITRKSRTFRMSKTKGKNGCCWHTFFFCFPLLPTPGINMEMHQSSRKDKKKRCESETKHAKSLSSGNEKTCVECDIMCEWVAGCTCSVLSPFPSSSQGIVLFTGQRNEKVHDANFFLSLMRFDQTNTFVKGFKDKDKVQPIAPLTPSYELIDISSYFSALEQETRKKKNWCSK